MSAGTCPFRLAVINDEITQDFEKACQIVSGDFGLRWIELRSMWNKNVTELTAKEVENAQKILIEHKLQVTDIASPLFKVDWPGAPKSKYSPKGSAYGASFSFEQQDEVLERATAMARQFGTNHEHPSFVEMLLFPGNPLIAIVLLIGPVKFQELIVFFVKVRDVTPERFLDCSPQLRLTPS
jgi:hypothetical protein